MLALVLTLPLVDALSIANVAVTDVTDKNARVQWTTDVASDSTVRFGVTGTAGLEYDSNQVTQHNVLLHGLQAGQQYQLSVGSAAGAQQATDDNNGAFYRFATAAQDTFSPFLDVTVPAIVNRARIDVRGKTEDDAEVRLIVNGQFLRRMIPADGKFEFLRVPLAAGESNTIDITVQDTAGQINQASFVVQVDTKIPEITASLPAVVGVSSFALHATVSEEAQVTVNVDNQSLFSQKTAVVDVTIPLDDGEHEIVLTATDDAGNVDTLRHVIVADTTPPEINDVKPLERTAFYYEGKATDTVRGMTEPGARAYMLVDTKGTGFSLPGGLSAVFSTGGSQLTSNQLKEVTDKAQYVVNAAADGTFEFKDVNFEHPGFGLEETAPEEIPSGTKIEEQRGSTDVNEKNVRVLIVVVDAVGLSNSRSYSVNIGTCFSGFGVSIGVLPEYQAPSLLSPNRLDTGTEIVSFVLSTEYKGSAQNNKLDPKAKVRDDDYYQITDVTLQPLCRESPFLESHESYQFACQIIGRRPVLKRAINVEHSNWYFRYNLGSSDKFTKFDEEFWKKTLNNELRFPFEITVNFDEKLPGKQPESKSVKLCRDVVYFVDVPVDPRKVLPDGLLHDAQKLTNQTIKLLNDIIPTVEKITRYAGIGCLGSFGLRTVVQVYRRFMQRWESISCRGIGGVTSVVKGGKNNCPIQNDDQIDNCFFIADDGKPPYPDGYLGTLSSWQCSKVKDTRDKDDKPVERGKDVKIDIEKSEEAKKYFSGTINAWQTEMKLYQLYRYICDRAFCHSAPAKWTQDKSLVYIQKKEYEQRDCPAPATRYLREVKNCEEELLKKQGLLDKNFLVTRSDLLEGGASCYRLDNAIYVVDKKQTPVNEEKYAILTRVDTKRGLATSNQLESQPSELIAVPEAGQWRTADTKTCKQTCDGIFGRDKSEYICDASVLSKETPQRPIGEKNAWFDTATTMDCWATPPGRSPDGSGVAPGTKNFDTQYLSNDCFCREASKAEENKIQTEQKGAKQAGADKGGFGSLGTEEDDPAASDENPGEWPWNYREWRIYEESGHHGGIYYPTNRYYDRRDFSAAFGQNYLLDYVLKEDSTPIVSHRELIGTFQTVCLPGIRSRLVTLRSLLIGFQRCLKEVETTGKADAGVCKEIFSQLVCNLAYKVFTLFQNQCIPGSVDKDFGLTDYDAMETFFKTGSEAVTDTAESMTKEVHDEYGNVQLDQFLNGGSEALMKKVCLAAFGIETGFDLDSFLDSAYSTSLDTSVGVFSSEGGVGRREYLSFDPATRQSIFEYRAAWLILPGCALQNYQLELVAITAKEDAQFSNTECNAVNNKEQGSNGCDNYNGDVEKRTSFYGGRPVQQGIYVDQNKAMNVPSQYRYDHIKVTLYPDKQDAAKCFPKGSVVGNAGVFYFPIHDATPRDLLQCKVEPTGGIFLCSFGDDQGVGQAWLQSVECYDSDTASFKRCDRVVFSAEDKDEIRIRANVFSSGKKMCLRAYVEPQNHPRLPVAGNEWWDVFSAGEPGITPMDLPMVTPITQEYYNGRAGLGIELLTPDASRIRCSLVPSTTDDGSVSEKNGGPIVLFTFEAVEGKPGSSRLNVQGNVHVSAKGSSQEYSIDKSGYLVNKKGDRAELRREEFTPIRYVVYGYGATNIFGDLQGENKRDSCIVRTFASPDKVVNEQKWPLHLELFYPNEQEQCGEEGTVPVVLPTGVAFKTKEEIPLRVVNTKVTTARMAAFNRGKLLYYDGVARSNVESLQQAANQFFESTKSAPKDGDMQEVESWWWRTVSLVKILQLREREKVPLSVISEVQSLIRQSVVSFESRTTVYEEFPKPGESPNAKLSEQPKYKLIKAYMLKIKESPKLKEGAVF